VTLWWRLKSSEFGAILWLLLRGRDDQLNAICSLCSCRFSPGFDGLSGHEIPKQFYGIGAQCTGYRNKFDDINAALAAFVLGNERLRSAEFLGQGLLTDAGGMSHCDKTGN
jgi:hypothetical protein